MGFTTDIPAADDQFALSLASSNGCRPVNG